MSEGDTDHDELLSKSVCGECGEDLPSGDLADALRHYLNQHPSSPLLDTVLDSVTLQTECTECGSLFKSDVDSSASGHITTPAYCGECVDLLGPLYDLFVDEWRADMIAQSLYASALGDSVTSVLDGAQVSPEWNDLYITCPNCKHGTVVDFEDPYCDHCNAIVRVSITAHMTGGDDDE